MRRNILVFFGSPRKWGNCAKALNILLKDFRGIFSFNIIDAYKKAAKPCDGCDICKKFGKCKYSDLDVAYSLLKSIPNVITISPIYNLSFPAPLKAIFDRFQLYFNLRAKDSIIKKKVILILSCGRKMNKTHISVVVTQAYFIFKSINADIKKIIIIDNTDKIKAFDNN